MLAGLVWPRTVTGRSEGLCSRAGLWWLAEVADQLGLIAWLRWAMRRLSWRDHHPGTTMTVMILALADGATAMSDMAMLRGLKTLFGPVASTTTLWRTFQPDRASRAPRPGRRRCFCRATAWALEVSRSRLVIDIDATIVACRSDKQDAAGTWKRSFGFHPLVEWTPNAARCWPRYPGRVVPGRTPRSGQVLAAPLVPAYVIATMLVLQALEGYSDRDALRALVTHLRWKVAAGLTLDSEGFHGASDFRAKFEVATVRRTGCYAGVSDFSVGDGGEAAPIGLAGVEQ